jgi:hypothetical protein
LCLAVLPAAAYAQASIQGVVKDTSGAVLPGVTVEASSPVLIEKTRSTVTDGSGQYQIINLLPGTYTVTFTLSGFNVFKREGIELSGSFVATLNADMKVGALEETITVTGQTPLVDVRSAAVQKVVTKEIVDAVPTGRLGINLAALQPGIILGAGGGVGVSNTNSLTSRLPAANVGNNERLAMLLAGAALLGYAWKNSSKGLGLTAAGLLARGATGYCPAYAAAGIDRRETKQALSGGRGVHIREAVTITAPPDQIGYAPHNGHADRVGKQITRDRPCRRAEIRFDRDIQLCQDFRQNSGYDG